MTGFLSDGSGSPLRKVRRSALPAPDVVVAIETEIPNDGPELRGYVTVAIDEVPAGAVALRLWANDARGKLIWAVDVPAEAGHWRADSLPYSPHSVQRRLRIAWVGAGNAIGRFRFARPVQPGDGEEEPDPFRVALAPQLVLNETSPLALGTALGWTPPIFAGGVPPYSVGSTLQTADDAEGAGTEDDGHVGGAPIGAGLVGKHVRVKAVGADSATPPNVVEAASDWSEFPVYNPAPSIAPDVVGHRWAEVAPDEYLLVLAIAGIDPGDYAGLDGDKRLYWARRPTNPAVQPNWEVLSPYDYEEGEEPPIAGSAGEWRLNTLSTTASGTWIKPNRHLPLHRPSDQHDILVSFSLDAGVNRSLVTEIDLKVTEPIFPWLEEEPTPTSGHVWRPMDRSPQQASAAGGLYGLGHQYCRGSAQNGNRVYLAGDMAFLRRSDDGGVTFFMPRCIGLPAVGFNAVAVDPVDPDRVIVWCHAAWMDGWNVPPYATESTGVWLSTNGGDTFVKVLGASQVPSSDNTYGQSTIVFDPATIGAAPASRRWYFISHRTNGGGQVWVSNSGGMSWAAQGSAVTASKFGRVYMLRMHPVTANRFFVCALNGLWQSNGVPSSDASWVRVGTGLPNGVSCRSIAISPDGNTLVVSIFGGTAAQCGVWRSTNGGSTWSRINDANVKDIAVDWLSSPYVIYARVPGNAADQRMLVSRTGGASFVFAPAADPMPGVTGNGLAKAEFEAYMLVHPTIAGVCLNHCSDKVARTVDKGVSWTFRATHGFTGVNTAMQNVMVNKHPTIPGRIDLAAEDIGRVTITGYGTGGLVTSNVNNTAPSPANPNGQKYWTAGRTSSSAICVLRSGRVILAAGAINQLLFRQEPGSSAWIPGAFTGGSIISPQAINPTTQAQYDDMRLRYQSAMKVVGCIKEHPTADNVVWGGPLKSTNGGVNWVQQSYSLVDMWPDGTGLFSSGNNQLYRSSNWHTGAPTFTPFYQAPITLFAVDRLWCVARCDPFDNRAVYTLGSTRDLVRVRNTGTTFDNAAITSLALQPVSGLSSTFFRLGSVAPDDHEAGTIYVTIAWSGFSTVWRRRNGVWEDVTGNAYRWAFLGVDVVNGQAVIGGGGGLWMLDRPVGYPTAGVPLAIYPNLVEPVPASRALAMAA